MKILKQQRICTVRGCDVWLQHIEDNAPPSYASYCVQYGGGGRYFPTLEEAQACWEKTLADSKKAAEQNGGGET